MIYANNALTLYYVRATYMHEVLFCIAACFLPNVIDFGLFCKEESADLFYSRGGAYYCGSTGGGADMW